MRVLLLGILYVIQVLQRPTFFFKSRLFGIPLSFIGSPWSSGAATENQWSVPIATAQMQIESPTRIVQANRTLLSNTTWNYTPILFSSFFSIINFSQTLIGKHWFSRHKYTLLFMKFKNEKDRKIFSDFFLSLEEK